MFLLCVFCIAAVYIVLAFRLRLPNTFFLHTFFFTVLKDIFAFYWETEYKLIWSIFSAESNRPGVPNRVNKNEYYKKKSYNLYVPNV